MRKICIFLCLIMILASCNKAKDNSAKLAEVNGDVLTLEGFKANFGVEEWDSIPPELRKKYVEDWVNLTLLSQAADDQDLDKDLALKQRISYATKKVKANAIIASKLAAIQVSEDQLFSYFRIHQAEFTKPVMTYNIQRIQLADKLSAEKVMQQLSQGMDFGMAVNRYSLEPLKAKGGVMGFVTPASADSSFWIAARDLQPNDIGILSKAENWYVFRYTESKESGGEANFEDYRAEIKRKIILEKQEEVYQGILREIKARQNEIYYY